MLCDRDMAHALPHGCSATRRLFVTDVPKHLGACRPHYRFGRLFQNDFCRLMLPVWSPADIGRSCSFLRWIHAWQV